MKPEIRDPNLKQRVGTKRGVVVLDGAATRLGAALAELNMSVILLPAIATEVVPNPMLEMYCAGRILVTDRPLAFQHEAPV